MEQVIMVTVGIISHLWLIILAIAIWGMTESFEVKYLGHQLTIKPIVILPISGIILFWVWMYLT